MSTALAIVSADWHLSHKPPLARSVEEDWYGVQQRYIEQVLALTEKRLPVVIAGDVFDRASPPHELVHFAMRMFNQFTGGVYAVAGNHDLPQHSLADMHRSGYGILAESGVITDLKPGHATYADEQWKVILHGFPCGYEVRKNEVDRPNCLQVAVVHDYIWKDSASSYPGAPEEKRTLGYQSKLNGYDVAIFGDNHIPFEAYKIFNCGGFLRRKIDEIEHKPSVGILYDDSSIQRHYLDTNKDKFTEASEIIEAIEGIGAETFVEELRNLGDTALDFSASIHHLLERNKVSDVVKKIILNALEIGDGI